MTRTGFDRLYDDVQTWSRWRHNGERGALNHLTAASVVAAAGLVREGRTISLGLPLDTQPGIDNPQPAVHRMTLLPDRDGGDQAQFAKDYVGLDFHNDGHSHIDALSHVAYHDSVYGGQSAESVTAAGAAVGAIELLADGLVGRGVLLDIPRVRGVDWLEPGDQVTLTDLERALSDQGVSIREGDLLFIRLGHTRRLAVLPPWDTGHAKAGLDPAVAPFLADHRVAALGSDGNHDTAPSRTEGVAYPMHVLAIHAMGLHLLDYLQFEELTAHCQQRRRWEFLCVVAPLRIDGGTGSPVNPIAIF